MRKWPPIDLLYLYTQTSSSDWNDFLTRCFQTHDIATLTKTRYGIQAGMADLSRQKLNTDKMVEFFIRLERSIEKTVKRIVREKDTNPCDDPLLAIHNIEFKDQKNERDNNLELYFKKTGY